MEAEPTPVVRIKTSLPWRRFAWVAGIGAGVVGVIWLASLVRGVSVPLLVAFAFAYILDPVVDRITARGLQRTHAILALLLVALIVLAGAGLIVVPQVARELTQLPARLHELLARLQPWAEATLGVVLPSSVSGALHSVAEALRAGSTDPSSYAISAGPVLRAAFGSTVSALAAVAGVVMIPVFQFFLLRDFDLIVARAKALIPLRYREPVSARVREIDQALSSFVRGQLIVASILAVLYSTALSIVGIPLALVIGVLTGLGNMVPYVGPAIGLTLAALMAVLEWQGPVHLALVVAVFIVVQLLEAWVITPRIVGNSVGLSTFAVIVAVLVFGQLFGFFGVLLAVPATAVLKILARVGLEHYRSSSFFLEA